MANTVKLGSVNFPKLMRQVGYRTNQVRDLVFARDAIFQKTVGNKKDDDGSPGDGTGRSTAMAGPDVSFGYEGRLSTALPGTAANTAYHVDSPELILPGLKAVQTPIISRSGNLERTGHRITGACTFYMPSMGYIRALDNFSHTPQFDEIETFDKLIDMERVIFHAFDKEGVYGDSTTGGYLDNGYNVSGGMDDGLASTRTTVNYTNSDPYIPGYEMDRIQFQVKSAGILDYVIIDGVHASTIPALKWDGNVQLSASDWTTIDLPLRKDNGESVAVDDTTTVYRNGTAHTFTAGADGGALADFDKFQGVDGSNFQGVQIRFTTNVAHDIRNLKIYKQAEWRVESIKDYRDEYMEVAAVRVRGDRTSRRRAYG